MKLFVLVSRVPYPLEKGDKLRAYHQVRELAAHHHVILCCLSDRRPDPAALAHLRTIVQEVHVVRLNRLFIAWRLALAVFSRRPYQVAYFYQSGAAAQVRRLIRETRPDHLYCQLVRCAEYVKHLHDHRKTLDYMDALNAGHLRRVSHATWYLRDLLREEARRLVAYEHLIFDYFDHHTIISRQDQQLIYHPHRNRIHIVPNGVDTNWLAPQDTTPVYDLVFTGNMSYPPNVDGARRLVLELLPRIRKAVPGITVLIAGANPSEEVRELASAQVTVSGWVDEIRDAYASSRIFVAPMRTGSGMQNKLLEAMSMGLPCVTTSLAANAFRDEIRQCLVTADEDDQLADAIVSLLEDPERRNELGQAGRNGVMRHHSWSDTARQLSALFSQ